MFCCLGSFSGRRGVEYRDLQRLLEKSAEKKLGKMDNLKATELRDMMSLCRFLQLYLLVSSDFATSCELQAVPSGKVTSLFKNPPFQELHYPKTDGFPPWAISPVPHPRLNPSPAYHTVFTEEKI